MASMLRAVPISVAQRVPAPAAPTVALIQPGGNTRSAAPTAAKPATANTAVACSWRDMG